MKLKLQDCREEVARIRRFCRQVILGACVKVLLAAWGGRRQSLILRAQIPPGFVVVFWLNLARENFPPPLIDEITKRQKRHLIKRALQQKSKVRTLIRHFVDKSNLLEIRWCYRQG